MKEYFVTRGGVELVVKLRPETAKRLKARPVEAPEPKARVPRNKGRTPANKSK